MLEASVRRLEHELPDDALVLDIGGWGRPFRRADWVIDRMPYQTRGLYGFDGAGPERFDESRWVQRDICDKTPFPFADDEFDFVICSQTLEDIRDPIWVCEEIARIGKAGYVEVPSRLEEQSYGVHGPWVGWSHHHWLIDVGESHLDFVFKPHLIHGRPAAQFPAGFIATLTPEERAQQLWWTGGFAADERVFTEPTEMDQYVESFVQDRGPQPAQPGQPLSRSRRLAGGLRGRAAARASRAIKRGGELRSGRRRRQP